MTAQTQTTADALRAELARLEAAPPPFSMTRLCDADDPYRLWSARIAELEAEIARMESAE